MTTGRINQVRTIGACLPGPARQGCGPQRALARPQGPASRRAPSCFVGGHAASARSRRLRTPGRVSPRLGGARLRPGSGAELPMRGGPRGRSLASPRPAPPSASARSRRLQTPGRVSPHLGGARLGPGWGPSCRCGVAPSGARTPAPGLRRPRLAGPRPRWPGLMPAPSRFVGGHAALAQSGWLQTPGRVSPCLGGALLGPGPRGRALAGPRPAPSLPGQTASPPPSSSHIRSAGASTRQAVVRPSVLSGCVLRLGRRRATRRPQPARFLWDGCPRGKTPPGYAAATARLTPRAHLDATAHRRQDKDAPRPAAGQGLAPSACGAGALAAARGPATVRFAC